MRILNVRKAGSHMAKAVALATGTAMIGTLAFPDTAHAQKKKKEKKAKPEYSEAFIAAYQPLNEQVNAEGADISALKPQIQQLAAVSTSPDEQIATGGLVYNSGAKLNDRGLQLQGMEMMLASGKVEPANVGRFNFIAYQLSNSQNDFGKARDYLQKAIDNNFSTPEVSVADLRIAMAESYFSEEAYRDGLQYLKSAIADQKSAGATVDEQWYRRGLTVAYNNEITPEVYEFATAWVGDYPSETNWRDAINIARNLNQYEAAEMLDLMRLSKRADALTNKQDYIEYIEAADARRLPKEVSDLIEQGYATGIVSRDDIYVADSLELAKGRIAADRADLPALENDARASGAGLRTVTAAGDAFLSYGEFAKAAEFYEKSLGMPGVETARVLTRLGIAQYEMGDFAAASATFEKVDGVRRPIAQLWATYSTEKAATSAAATTAEAPAVVGG